MAEIEGTDRRHAGHKMAAPPKLYRHRIRAHLVLGGLTLSPPYQVGIEGEKVSSLAQALTW